MKPDYSKLPKDLQDKIAGWEANNPVNKQLRKLEDIASIMQDMSNVLDFSGKKQADKLDDLGKLLVDAREQLVELNSKEAPEAPDTAKPVVDAISKLETAIATAMKATKAPIVNVPKADAPIVNVDAPNVTLDTKEIAKILKSDLPEAFNKAIQNIVIPVNDTTESNQLLEQIAEQLSSIDTGVRLKPQAPTTIGINNDVTTLDKDYATRLDDSASPILYIGKAPVGSAEGSAVWQIAKLDTSSGLIKTWAGTGFDQIWDDRTSLTYS